MVFGLGGGQLDHHRSSARMHIERGNLPAVFADNRVADAQSQPHTLALVTRRIKRIEDASRLRKSWPASRERHLDVVADGRGFDRQPTLDSIG